MARQTKVSLEDATRAVLTGKKTVAKNRFADGGRTPPPVSLPKLKFLEIPPPDDIPAMRPIKKPAERP